MNELEKELGLQKLYRELLDVELGDRSNQHNEIKFIVAILRTLSIRMDGDKRHQRPHVHIGYGREHRKASYAIDDGSRLSGDLESEYDRVAKGWIRSQRKRLRRLWNAVQEGKDRSAIIASIQRTSYE